MQNFGIFVGPHDESLVQSFKAWNSNAVRIPLNEDCWLGINGINEKYSGKNYQDAIYGYAKMFTDAGMVAILDLHWTAPGSTQATGTQPMPDTDHSVDFWKSVAQKFSDNGQVIFELFNEPFPDSGSRNTTAGWECWKNGGSCKGVSFQAAGMQTLLDAVRGTNATNVILLGGLAWSNSLFQWLEYVPQDPLHNTAASWHCYNFNYCSNEECWNSTVGAVKAKYPVVATEFGENLCNGSFVTPLMEWMDTVEMSYLAWTFNNWDCNHAPALITTYDNEGEPTAYGAAVKKHYSL